MSHLGALRTFLEAYFPRTTAEEQQCTCGAGNHVRLRYFRVNGQPVTAVIPEGANLTAQDLRVAMGCAWAESLPDEEAGKVLEDTELGHMDWFENPFGSSVFLDDLLLPYAEIEEKR